MIEPHEVEDPKPVFSVIVPGRMACSRCDESVFERQGRWLHFRSELNLTAEGDQA